MKKNMLIVSLILVSASLYPVTPGDVVRPLHSGRPWQQGAQTWQEGAETINDKLELQRTAQKTGAGIKETAQPLYSAKPWKATYGVAAEKVNDKLELQKTAQQTGQEIKKSNKKAKKQAKKFFSKENWN